MFKKKNAVEQYVSFALSFVFLCLGLIYYKPSAPMPSLEGAVPSILILLGIACFGRGVAIVSYHSGKERFLGFAVEETELLPCKAVLRKYCNDQVCIEQNDGFGDFSSRLFEHRTIADFALAMAIKDLPPGGTLAVENRASRLCLAGHDGRSEIVSVRTVDHGYV